MSNNPFADVFGNFSNQVPSFNFAEAVEAGKKNFEVFQEANQAIVEGAQEFTEKQIEIAKANTESAIKLFKEVASSRDIRDGASKQADFAKKAFEKATKDTNDLIEIASKSNNKAAEIVGKQVSEPMQDIKKVATPAKKAKAA